LGPQANQLIKTASTDFGCSQDKGNFSGLLANSRFTRIPYTDIRVLIVLWRGDSRELGCTLIVDFVVFAHLFCVACGLGMSAKLDLEFFLSRKVRPTESLMADVERSHFLIVAAMVGLWASGLALVYLRTGFVAEMVSAKLWMKMIVVTVLTVNSVIISIFVIPKLYAFPDLPVLAFPMRAKVPMAVCSAVSSVSWLSALALGAMTTLKMQPWAVLAPLFGGAYGAGMLVAVAVVLCTRGADQQAQVPVR